MLTYSVRRGRAVVTGKMRAMGYHRFGDPMEVLAPTQARVPTIAGNEVLVKVRAVAVNPLDWHLMVGKPAFARLMFGVRKPKRSIPGNDIAGTVEAVGPDVTRFRTGDEVFGETSGGGMAEYVAVSEDGLVAKPESLTFEEAAAVPVAALTALQGLRDWGGMRRGDRVMIVGASGGVGTYAVQIARALGASHITGVCSTRNVDTARALGADRVIDYTSEDLASDGDRYDVIFDGPGDQPLRSLRRLLRATGTYVLIGGPKGNWVAPLPRLLAMRAASLLGLMNVGNGTAVRDQGDLLMLRDWLASGQIRSVIDRTYSLDEAADALAYQGTFHARGKIIVIV